MNYNSWDHKTLSINGLLLDEVNPRLPRSATRPTQPSLIRALVDHEEVMPLARDIAKFGYFPDQVLVGCKLATNRKLTILEGNRRLAALKLLANPELLEGKARSLLKRYTKLMPRKISKVPVTIAPTRSAAMPLIVAKHDGSPNVKKWSPTMQWRFIREQFDEGSSIQDIAKNTGLSQANVIDRYMKSLLGDVISSLPLDPAVHNKAVNVYDFPFSTLDRIISNQSGSSLLAISPSARHGFTTDLNKPSFVRVLQRIVTDVATGVVTSRSLNTNAEISAYAAHIRAELRGKITKSTKSIPADAFMHPSSPAAKVVAKGAAPRAALARKPRKSVGMIPKSFKVQSKYPRVQAMVEELKTLRVENHPNAIGVLFRALLDVSLSRYMFVSGEMKRMRDEQRKKKGGQKPPHWSPSLNQQLKRIANSASIGLEPSALKAVKNFANDSARSITYDKLDAYAHNGYTQPTDDELRGMWERLAPLMEALLTHEDK